MADKKFGSIFKEATGRDFGSLPLGVSFEKLGITKSEIKKVVLGCKNNYNIDINCKEYKFKSISDIFKILSILEVDITQIVFGGERRNRIKGKINSTHKQIKSMIENLNDKIRGRKVKITKDPDNFIENFNIKKHKVYQIEKFEYHKSDVFVFLIGEKYGININNLEFLN